MTDESSKIEELGRLACRAQAVRESGGRVVLCHGTFDLVHTGHIRHLQQARREGEALFVTVTADRFVNKGPGRPVFRAELRAETLAALACVDGVAIVDEPTAVTAIRRLCPDVYAKGSEYARPEDDITGNIEREREAVESGGGRLFFTDGITFSSSHLLNEYFEVFPPQTRVYLRDLRQRYGAPEVQGWIESLRDLRTLVVGDAIVDEYHYTRPLGETGKGNILSVGFESREQFAGGAIAVANHVAGFAREVTLVSALGREESHEEFIRSRLEKGVRPEFFHVEGAGTLVKRRFVDRDLAKLFEVYCSGPEPIGEEVDADVCQWLDRHAGGFDAVVVPDFGNGFISSGMVQVLCRRSRFLAVNTQINSGNRGYHSIRRYPRADFVSLNEPELRMAAHDRADPIERVAESVGSSLSADFIAVTRGTEGALLSDLRRRRWYDVPVLSTKVLDRIGAGDAFLSLAGLCLARGVPPEVAVFAGSAAAAVDVQIVCNREAVDRTRVLKFIATILK